MIAFTFWTFVGSMSLGWMLKRMKMTDALARSLTALWVFFVITMFLWIAH